MKEFWTDIRAVTPTEYALLAAFVSLVAAGALAVTGKNLSGMIGRITAVFGEGEGSGRGAQNY